MINSLETIKKCKCSLKISLLWEDHWNLESTVPAAIPGGSYGWWYWKLLRNVTGSEHVHQHFNNLH